MQIKSLILYDYQLDHANQKFGFIQNQTFDLHGVIGNHTKSNF
jgi:hypothetical protein